jgi:CheY-like chemotaxis protein
MGHSTTHVHKRVMVIDDNEVDRYVASYAMEKHLFAEEVVCYELAKEALEYLVSLEDTPEELPELIFLDINMPEMNGFEFLEEYGKLSENIKKNCIIMMLTTSLNEADRVRAEENKYVFRFLSKPMSMDKIETFATYLKK